MSKFDFEIVLRVFPNEGPNGDRATRMTPYNDYELVLMYNNDNSTAAMINKGSDYDHFYSHIDSGKSDYKELKRIALALSEKFDWGLREVVMVEQVETIKTWVEETAKKLFD